MFDFLRKLKSTASPARQPSSQFVCAVVGESHKNRDGESRQSLIKRLVKVGMPAQLIHEPDNPADKNAVAVFVAGKQIGYLKRDVAKWHVKRMDRGDEASAIVHGVHGGTRDKPSIGVTLEVSVYE
ncbi:HIRAN domain-containing protein [Stutzerimonas kunmingensis]|uniref:HIRAN domain-containing protein n=1 Tax=Stutzerimonas kunmingensis TaxID=1211807 RepID=UPI002896C68D|nr:HIRAN domain-containing protein [Stutzerimonas kunmingensis]